MNINLMCRLHLFDVGSFHDFHHDKMISKIILMIAIPKNDHQDRSWWTWVIDDVVTIHEKENDLVTSKRTPGINLGLIVPFAKMDLTIDDTWRRTWRWTGV